MRRAIEECKLNYGIYTILLLLMIQEHVLNKVTHFGLEKSILHAYFPFPELKLIKLFDKMRFLTVKKNLSICL